GPDNITVLIVRVPEQPAAPVVQTKQSKRRFHQLIPWPPLALIVGLLLVAYAALLTANDERTLALIVFLPAAGFILGGVAGFFVTYTQERQQPPREVVHSQLRMSREFPCGA